MQTNYACHPWALVSELSARYRARAEQNPAYHLTERQPPEFRADFVLVV